MKSSDWIYDGPAEKVEYDPSNELTYPYYKCPQCGSAFYGGGKALHNNGCNLTGYDACIVVMGPVMIADMEERGHSTIFFKSGLWTVDDLKRNAPHVWKEYSEQQKSAATNDDAQG